MSIQHHKWSKKIIYTVILMLLPLLHVSLQLQVLPLLLYSLHIGPQATASVISIDTVSASTAMITAAITTATINMMFITAITTISSTKT